MSDRPLWPASSLLGYQPEVMQYDQKQQNDWLKNQPGYSSTIQGPPTPFAMHVNMSPLEKAYEQKFDIQIRASKPLTPAERAALAKEEMQLDQRIQILKLKYR